ncbi:MAG TPA: capsule assembly Wzi family protein [Candidatus Saccharimonadales bacterium]|nr:capsule assembly Wzi family protein [Candidatus Saccharimonadales bacterium]
MPSKWLRILLASAALAGAAAPASGQPAIPPERLPTGHWSYEDLEELAVAGALDSLWVYTRPLSRGDAAAALLAAAARFGSDPRHARLLREFAQEASELDSARAPSFTRHLVDVGDADAALRAWPRARLGESREPGRGWHSDSLSELGFQGLAQLRPHWTLYTDMLMRKYAHGRDYADPLFTGTDITLLTQQAYVAANYGPLQAMLGRDRVRWGLGQTGSLLLGDAAPAMTLVEYSLHWRRLHATAITSLLEPGLGGYLSGHRLEWHPGRAWLVGLSEVARYTSRQPDLLYLSGIIPYTLVQRLLAADARGDTSLDVRNNIMVALEGAWRPRPGVQLGGTLLLDDVQRRADQPGSRYGYQLSVLLTQTGRARPATLRVEYTRILDYVYSVYYGEDYIHQGASLAYPLGPDLARLSGRLSVDVSRDLKAWVAADYLAHGEGTLGQYLDVLHPGLQAPPGELLGVVEKTLGLDAGARWFARDNVQLEGSLGWRRVRDAAHVAGARLTQLVGSLALEGRW